MHEIAVLYHMDGFSVYFTVAVVEMSSYREVDLIVDRQHQQGEEKPSLTGSDQV